MQILSFKGKRSNEGSNVFLILHIKNSLIIVLKSEL